jgi:hypothetical protein
VNLNDATDRYRTDHEILQNHLHRQGDITLHAGPLGDFCESLHDLVAHVLMWDEINLAVLTEANAGRRHWSLDPRWETREAGRLLNKAGVLAGRELPSELLLHRLEITKAAVETELESSWEANQDVAEHVFTVPGRPAFWHAAIHLNAIPK